MSIIGSQNTLKHKEKYSNFRICRSKISIEFTPDMKLMNSKQKRHFKKSVGRNWLHFRGPRFIISI